MANIIMGIIIIVYLAISLIKYFTDGNWLKEENYMNVWYWILLDWTEIGEKRRKKWHKNHPKDLRYP